MAKACGVPFDDIGKFSNIPQIVSKGLTWPWTPHSCFKKQNYIVYGI